MLISWMKSKSNGSKVRVFSDEKLFTVDPVLNRRNSRYISGDRAEEVDPAVKCSSKTKHPTKIMMLGVVASDGEKCPPIFTPANEKINTEQYLEMLNGMCCRGYSARTLLATMSSSRTAPQPMPSRKPRIS